MSSAQSTEPVTMAIMGGLGNQLFQFATGMQVATNAGVNLQLDLSWFLQRLRRSHGVTLRPYELARVADGIASAPAATSQTGLLLRHSRDVLMRRLGEIHRGRIGKLHYDTRADFDAAILSSPPGTFLSGYFPSWRYFVGVQDDVRSRILSAVSSCDWQTELVQEARNSGAIGVHVRRGDYLTLASTYGHVSPFYYARAMRALRSLGMNGPVWLFSDEPAEAAKWLAGSVSVDRVIEPPPETTPIDSLVAMAATKALVIANSSFSWWAAYTGDSPDRPVIAPRPTWAQSKLQEPIDSLLPDWLTLDCRDFEF